MYWKGNYVMLLCSFWLLIYFNYFCFPHFSILNEGLLFYSQIALLSLPLSYFWRNRISFPHFQMCTDTRQCVGIDKTTAAIAQWLSNVNSHTYDKLHTASVYQIAVHGIGWPRIMVEDACPRRCTVGLNSRLHGWEAQILITQARLCQLNLLSSIRNLCITTLTSCSVFLPFYSKLRKYLQPMHFSKSFLEHRNMSLNLTLLASNHSITPPTPLVKGHNYTYSSLLY